jgi:DNA-nicking Smr family endonuclease
MTKQRRRSDRGSKLISDEDLALWRHATGSLDPLRGARKARVTFGSEAALSLSPPRASLKHDLLVSSKPPDRETSDRLPIESPARPPVPSATKAPRLAEFEHRSARRLRSGRIEIEARLDLHGLRQNEAHSALRSFLLNARARGLRWVLVITGKGGGASQDRPVSHFHEVERGVLRRNVPRWLAEPEMRALVVSYTAAAIPHGGEGALYIQLRTKRK